MVESDSTRRGFVSGLAASLAAIPFVGSLVVAARAAATPERIVRPARIPLARVAEVPERGLLPQPVTYELRRGPAVETVAEVVYLGRDAQSGTIIALSGRCTHLGCPVSFDAKDEATPLHCPCHDGRFDVNGAVVDGPPPRALDRLPIVVPEEPEGTIELVLS